MPKYKVGDRVIVADDLSSGERYYMDGSDEYDYATPEMEKHQGQVVTISTASKRGYQIREDSWHWTDGMFSGLENEVDDNTATEIDEDKFIDLICGFSAETDRGGGEP